MTSSTSFDVLQPYYVLTGVSGEIDQRLFGPIDVAGRAGAEQLAYRDRVGAVVPAPDRTDRVRTYGGSVGYRTSRDLRVAFNVDNAHRSSAVDVRQYNGLRMGVSVTYGF